MYSDLIFSYSIPLQYQKAESFSGVFNKIHMNHPIHPLSDIVSIFKYIS